MIICVCKALREIDLREHIRAGAVTLVELARRTGAGTDCGTCRIALEDLIHDEDVTPHPKPTEPA
ncbi:MAG: (2Fe-2S)-binding protein [Candidatus Eiseniibacteriota bacterium]